MYSYFLVSSQAHNERNALSEAYSLLMNFSKEESIDIYAQTLNIKGLGLLSLKNASIVLSEKSLKSNEEFLNEFKFCEKIIPLNGIIKEKNAKNFLKDKIKPYLSVINEDSTWKVDTIKRHSTIKTKEIIDLIVPMVEKGTVKLKNPDWLIHVNIIKNWIGYSILKPHFIFKLSKQYDD